MKVGKTYVNISNRNVLLALKNWHLKFSLFGQFNHWVTAVVNIYHATGHTLKVAYSRHLSNWLGSGLRFMTSWIYTGWRPRQDFIKTCSFPCTKSPFCMMTSDICLICLMAYEIHTCYEEKILCQNPIISKCLIMNKYIFYVPLHFLKLHFICL